MRVDDDRLGGVFLSADKRKIIAKAKEPGQSEPPTITYISLGAGVQSTALYILAVDGKLKKLGIDKIDYAVFADTQDEPKFVYEQLRRCQEYGGDTIPVEVVTAGRLSDVATTLLIPAFHSGGRNGAGQNMRTCTSRFKLEPIAKHTRRKLGAKPRGRLPEGAHATALIGISLDEVVRMKPCPHKWQTNRWPLVELGLSRTQCLHIVEQAGMPTPYRSACVFCPFRDLKSWQELRDLDPAGFQAAIDYDDKIRSPWLTASTKNDFFVHPSRTPLKDVDFSEDGQQLLSSWAESWDAECEGMCGV